ncbi:hypothetical protein CORC01_13268 [Colletotrichum orchidophilum]|uniref:Uncharacterized protein n=1 Tax=Colletotrichum orchidophilum TaxID=1209926 RepID=A0A1G4AQL2_9PEZI|nr:uncharacterized protein CORC01_13268 [Colletotrichum orchidophilum]OHE91449.1 hypothetical protein CORC01_13268 [Colletotrichum orchidophilum]
MRASQISPETFHVPPTPHSPNSTLPVVVYRNALENKTVEGALEAINTSEWVKGGHWKIANEALAAKPHYHSTTHEAYTVLQGSGTYVLGKSPLDADTNEIGNPVGIEFVARAGDVFAWPAGVTHFVKEIEDDYEIIGFYALTGFNSREEPYDMESPIHIHCVPQNLRQHREHVLRLWSENKYGNRDLAAVSIATNTALQLARNMEPEIPSAMQKLRIALGAIEMFYEAACAAEGQGPLYEQ